MTGRTLLASGPRLSTVLEHPDASHTFVEGISIDRTFGQSVGHHVTGVDPDQSLKNFSVKQFPKVLDVGEKRFLCRDFDECGGDSRVHTHRIHK